MEHEKLKRVIQESVPGKQVTLAHVIAHPDADLYKKLGVLEPDAGALGILTITPHRRGDYCGGCGHQGCGCNAGLCGPVFRRGGGFWGCAERADRAGSGGACAERNPFLCTCAHYQKLGRNFD